MLARSRFAFALAAAVMLSLAVAPTAGAFETNTDEAQIHNSIIKFTRYSARMDPKQCRYLTDAFQTTMTDLFSEILDPNQPFETCEDATSAFRAKLKESTYWNSIVAFKPTNFKFTSETVRNANASVRVTYTARGPSDAIGQTSGRFFLRKTAADSFWKINRVSGTTAKVKMPSNP
jgi:ABC-type transporter MlaC component